jgi:DNA-binding transcriptional LysR family regulator
VVPRTHHLAKRRRISLSETADEPFIALGSQFALRQLTNELWAAEGISPRVVFEAMEIATIEGLAAAGLGIAVVPAAQPNRADPRRPISRSQVRTTNAPSVWPGSKGGPSHRRPSDSPAS